MNTSIEANTNAVPPPIPGSDPAPDSASEATNATRDSAVSNIIVGGLWCVGGILVTALTYSAAKESGGYFIVAWGAILFGGIQFLKGLFQLGE